MAFIAQDDKQLQNGQDPNAQQPMGGGGASGIVGGSAPGATVGGQPVSSAGVGKGGSGGWTNIQAYLGANQDNKEDSAKKLNTAVGGQFETEQQKFNSQATDTKQKAETSANANKIGQDQASQMIERMGTQYQYPQTQTQDPLQAPKPPTAYEQDRSKFQGALNAQYAGPEAFAYGVDGKTQEYGTSLKQDDTFKNLMGTLYNDSAGGYLGKGGRLLQNQLDNGNEYLANARNDLLGKYSGLNETVTKGTEQANQVINNSRAAVDTNKADLRNYLTGQGSVKSAELDQAVADYNLADQANAKARNKVYWGDSYNPNANDDGITGNKYFFDENTPWRGQNAGYRVTENDDVGRVAYDVNEAQASSQQAYGRLADTSLSKRINSELGLTPSFEDKENYYKGNLTKFIEGANKNTKGVGDQQRGSFNSILDVLGLNGSFVNQEDNLKKGKYVIDGNNDLDALLRAGNFFNNYDKDGNIIR